MQVYETHTQSAATHGSSAARRRLKTNRTFGRADSVRDGVHRLCAARLCACVVYFGLHLRVCVRIPACVCVRAWGGDACSEHSLAKALPNDDSHGCAAIAPIGLVVFQWK